MGNSGTRNAMKQGADAEDDDQPGCMPSCFKKTPKPPPVIPTLVSLAVNGATQDGVRWWAVVSPVGNIRVVATTQPADNNGEWAQITWGGGGQTQNPANTRQVGLRGVQDGMQVTALLNGPVQTVTIDIYDLISLGCNLRTNLGANRWKDYAGFVVSGVARMTATTDRNQAWPKLVWTPAAIAGPALNQQDYATAAAGDVAVKVALGGKEIRGTLHLCQWPVVAVQEVTFSGGHTVNNDTVADFDNKWQVGRAVAGLDPAPICYTRNTAVTLTATLNVTTHPTDTETTLVVRGTAVVGGTTIIWTSAAITINPADATVSFPAAVAGSATVPNVVAAYNPMTITWEMSDPNGGWIGIGTTQHRMYVTLGNPTVTAYWTLLHYSCTGAAGATTPQALITGAFTPITGRNLSRQRDNMLLRYWDNPGAAAQVPDASANWNTALLLAAPLGRGHCGSWAEFLMDMFKVHGVTTGHKVNVTRDAVVQQIGPPAVVLAAAVNRGFLVATWTFAGVPATSATDLTHTQWTDCTPGAYAPGQNNTQPPPAFYNHWVVYCTTDGRIYDPSYGHDFPNPAAWESAPSISGLFSDGAAPNAGYNPVGGARLLRFRDTNANADL